jgi:hypothetical protein
MHAHPPTPSTQTQVARSRPLTDLRTLETTPVQTTSRGPCPLDPSSEEVESAVAKARAEPRMVHTSAGITPQQPRRPTAAA